MRLPVLISCLLGLAGPALGQTLHQSYRRISRPEFRRLDSSRLVLQRGAVRVYDVLDLPTQRGNRFHRLVLERQTGKQSAFYKLDDMAEIRNDSTIRFYGPPLLMVGGQDSWPEGKWLYIRRNNDGYRLAVDSVTAEVAQLSQTVKGPGIFRLQNGQLVRHSTGQSEADLNRGNLDGYFFVPDPGKFYLDVNLREIQ